jgi:hypothetical protein
MAYRTEADRKANARAYHARVGRQNSAALCRRNLGFLRRYKESHPCVDCGESRWWVLDFDHRAETDKTYNLTRMRYHKMERILAELAKCDVRCKNCHADRHYREGTRQSAIKIAPRF